MQCTECEAPNRKLWVLFGEHRRPALADVQTGSWAVLRRCPACSALWCLSPYEPYASFPFLALWPHDEVRWRHTFAVDDGRTLLAWHAFMVGQHFRSLPEPELGLVEQFRRRSYGHNPIDSPDTFHAADLPASTANA